MATPSEARAPEPMTLPPRIVFYDGVCGFCNGLVRWLIERDPDHRLHYAPLQGETARSVRAEYPDRFPEDIDTLVFFRRPSEGEEPRSPEALALRSTAAFAIARELGGRYWRSVAWAARTGIRHAKKCASGSRSVPGVGRTHTLWGTRGEERDRLRHEQAIHRIAWHDRPRHGG